MCCPDTNGTEGMLDRAVVGSRMGRIATMDLGWEIFHGNGKFAIQGALETETGTGVD